MKIEYHKCDIDKCESKATYINVAHNVIFHTEQTEGRYSDPYFEPSKLDLCLEHMGELIVGKTVHAHGAQGYNTYYIPTPNGEAYWKKRCELAENYIELSPCDYDVHEEQYAAYNKWLNFKNNE